MLEIKTIASGSKGNCYYISDGNTSILLEAGITFKEIQKGVNFKTSSIKACLITHSHKDHCKGVKTVLERGMDVYMSEGTKDEIGIDNHRIKVCEALKQFRVGSWIVLPFDVQHDTSMPLGYLLQSDYGHKVLFATDTYYIKYQFSGITHYLVECNYDQQTIDNNVAEGILHPSLRKRVMQSHMSLETLIQFFKANDLSKCEEIYLLHLSSNNSNKKRIFEEVAKVTGKSITIVG